MYSVIKCNKQFILNLSSKDNFIQKLQANSREHLTIEEFLKFSYIKNWSTSGLLGGTLKYKEFDSLKESLSEKREVRKLKVLSSKVAVKSNEEALQSAINSKDKYSEKSFEIPKFQLQSKIISFQEYYDLWLSLPTYVQIRRPQRIFNSSDDGYNLSTLYSNCDDFIESHHGQTASELKSYHYTLILVET